MGNDARVTKRDLPLPVTDPLEGTGFRTIRKIGAGGMGEVVEAEHVALKKLVVVKLLLGDLVKRPQLVDRMRIEAQAMSRLSSPHIAKVTHFSVTPSGRPYFVMDKLEGHTLGDEIKARRALPWPEAVELTRQALVGLSVAHKAGLVHRDVKPANLFLCDADPSTNTPPLVKVLDFGIAKVVDAANRDAPAPLAIPTEEGFLLGTPRFLSPEQVLGRAVDARADVYAAGLVLYTMVAGRGPFDAVKNSSELAKAHVLSVPPELASVAPQDVPIELERAVRKALAKNPADRFESADAFIDELAKIAAAATSVRWTKTEPLEEKTTPLVDSPKAIATETSGDFAPTVPLASGARDANDARGMSIGVMALSALFFAIVAVVVVLWALR